MVPVASLRFISFLCFAGTRVPHPPALSEGEGDLLSGCRQCASWSAFFGGSVRRASPPALVRPMAHEDKGSG